MFSIKTSLCSALMLASYAAAAAPGQSAINLEMKYCSSENTGASNDKNTDIYQTPGLCNDACQGKFAYAVLQWQDCWCSNEKPAEQLDLEECNQSCPGYPEQKCGNKGAGLYSYVPLDGAPVSGGNGTSTTSSAGPGSSASNSTAPAATSSSGASNSTSGTTGTSSSDNNANSTSSSDDASASYTGDSNGLSVPLNTLALSAVLGLAAFGFAA